MAERFVRQPVTALDDVSGVPPQGEAANLVEQGKDHDVNQDGEGGEPPRSYHPRGCRLGDVAQRHAPAGPCQAAEEQQRPDPSEDAELPLEPPAKQA